MNRDLHDAIGLAYDAGVHCDTCHKVKDVDMTKPSWVWQSIGGSSTRRTWTGRF